MWWRRLRGDDAARRDRARDWELTARLTLAVALAVGGLAAVASPRWDTGDLLVAVYFAAASLMLWGQSARIRHARSMAPFTMIVAVALGVAFALGLLLALVDLAKHGRSNLRGPSGPNHGSGAEWRVGKRCATLGRTLIRHRHAVHRFTR
jgi:asparagine N-glycosylation enzyme membrane subunit Stt3